MRYSELIRSIVSETLLKGDLFNSNLDISTITVSFVKMSRDLKIASIYVMPLGGENKDETLEILNENKIFFQKSISKAKLKSKFTPIIKFYIDNSFEEAEKIENLLLNKKVLRDLNNEWISRMVKCL